MLCQLEEVVFCIVISQDYCEGVTEEHWSNTVVAYFNVSIACRIYFFKLDYKNCNFLFNS